MSKIYRNEQRPTDTPVLLLSVNVGDSIWQLYSNFITHMLT